MSSIEAERPTRAPLPEPKPIELTEIKWVVIQTDNGPMVALTPEQYERLSYNLTEILRWIQEAMWRLQYYGTP